MEMNVRHRELMVAGLDINPNGLERVACLSRDDIFHMLFIYEDDHMVIVIDGPQTPILSEGPVDVYDKIWETAMHAYGAQYADQQEQTALSLAKAPDDVAH